VESKDTTAKKKQQKDVKAAATLEVGRRASEAAKVSFFSPPPVAVQPVPLPNTANDSGGSGSAELVHTPGSIAAPGSIPAPGAIAAPPAGAALPAIAPSRGGGTSSGGSDTPQVNGGAGVRENLRPPDIRADLEADEDDDEGEDEGEGEGEGEFSNFRRSFQRRLQQEVAANFVGSTWLLNALKADAGGGDCWRLLAAHVNAIYNCSHSARYTEYALKTVAR